MAEIIPRWEWRTFARTIETRIDLSAYPHLRHVESSETYLASATSEDNPKIRDDKLDIKSLQAVNEVGLEQWKPVLKASFPLSHAQLAGVYGVLKLATPPGEGPYSLDDLLRMIDREADAWATHAHKVRNLYEVDGCTVEAAEVSFDGEMFQTVAVEDPDPDKVRDTVARLGLLERENISYVSAVQRIKAGTLI